LPHILSPLSLLSAYFQLYEKKLLTHHIRQAERPLPELKACPQLHFLPLYDESDEADKDSNAVQLEDIDLPTFNT
jgi:hypothetical protein